MPMIRLPTWPSRKDGKWAVANIDFENSNGAFGLNTVPPPARFGLLKEGPISQATLDKVSRLVKSLEDPEGKGLARLKEIGLSDAQSQALLSRAKFLLEHKRIPEKTSSAIRPCRLRRYDWQQRIQAA